MVQVYSKARLALGFLVLLMLIGMAGFHILEGWSLMDSLYMTVITLSTVGFGEIRPLSAPGKLFTSALILLGVGTLAYIAAWTFEALVDRRLLHWRRVQMEIKRIQNHVIVCGYGRMGETICAHLTARKVPLVVIERDGSTSERLDRLGLLHVVGDATDDSTLNEAGVARARALAAVLPHDADNLFVTLTARKLNEKLTIVSRASIDKNESKMITAGANRVLNPYRNGGQLIVRQLLHPAVTEFIDVISGGVVDLNLEEVELQAGSSLVGVALRDAPIRRELDVIVVGVRRADRELLFNPPSDLAPRAGDVLVVLGRRDSLHRLEKLALG